MVGGEIMYRCLGNNVFEFTIILYQDCTPSGSEGPINGDNPLYYNIFSNSNNNRIINGTALFQSDGIISSNFADECLNNRPNICLYHQVYVFTDTLPPDSAGYTIAYQRCCRTQSILNVVAPGNKSAVYLATIPGFTNGQCPNNSAIFKNVPPQVICANNPFLYDFSATDIDGDSLSYSLCNSLYDINLDSTSASPKPSVFDAPPYDNMPFRSGYSVNQPIDGSISIDPVSGLLTGNPTSVGRYLVTVCVSEWRNGKLLTTRSRDIMFTITNCSRKSIANIPINSSFPNTYTVNCQDRTIYFENTSEGANTYNWHFGVPGATSTDRNPTYTFPDTGTYLVKLVINKDGLCPDSIFRYVKVYPTYNAIIDIDGYFCLNEDITFKDVSTSTFGKTIFSEWYYNSRVFSEERSTKLSFNSFGEKDIMLISGDSLGCKDTASVTIEISDFVAFAGNDTLVVKGYRYNFNAIGGGTYEWFPKDYLENPKAGNTAVYFPSRGVYEYYVKVKGEDGCEGVDTIIVTVLDDATIWMPNAFSPNGDGLNDRVMPKLAGYIKLGEFRIFNRWGELVYYTSKHDDLGWDGTLRSKPADIGVYYWTVSATNVENKPIRANGELHLLR